MMREVRIHHVPGQSETVRVFPEGEDTDPGLYRLSISGPKQETGTNVMLRFQKGPIPEAGANGLTNEALLAVVIDRLEQFQKGSLSCRENAIALTYLQNSLMWLQRRTMDRLQRKVEGTTNV